MQKNRHPVMLRHFGCFLATQILLRTHKYPQIIVSLLFRGRLIIQETWFLLEHIKH